MTLWQWRRAVSDLYGAVRHESDPAAAHTRWQSRRRVLFREHDQSPVEPIERGPYRGPYVYPYDPTMRFSVWLDPIAEAAEEINAGDDGMLTIVPFATTIGLEPMCGGELTLYWIEGYGGGVFVPFRDTTNGRETYGGGRYLLDTIKGADLGSDTDGRAILDFNFAYFPSCAYAPKYVCPLAPNQNRLPVAIRAGERNSPWADGRRI